MVNQDRVKQLYKIARYEQTEEKEYRQIGQYYRSDYVGKEIIKSIFTGTIAYAIMAILWVISNSELVLHQINTLEIVDTVVAAIGIYIAYLAVYLAGTAIVYYYRYEGNKGKVDAYVADLEVAQSMFEREEKLKS